VTLQDVWDRQNVSSQTADRWKKKIQNWRNVGLGFSLAGAILATAAVVAGLEVTTGKVLAAVGAFAVAVAGLTRPFAAHGSVQNWTRARSVSEGIKTEVFLYLTKPMTTAAATAISTSPRSWATSSAAPRVLSAISAGSPPSRESPRPSTTPSRMRRSA
jgi:hypothetical protein